MFALTAIFTFSQVIILTNTHRGGMMLSYIYV